MAIDTVGWRLAVEDAFSVALGKAGQVAGTVEQAFIKLGQASDSSTRRAQNRLVELNAQLDHLHMRGLQPGGLNNTDLDQYAKLNAGIAALNTQLTGFSGFRNIGSHARTAKPDIKAASDELKKIDPIAKNLNLILSQLGLGFMQFAGPTGIGVAIVSLSKFLLNMNEVGAKASEVKARFVAFAGGAAAAASDLKAMDDALGSALSRGQKMGTAGHIMSLELAASGEEVAKMAEIAVYLGDASQTAEQRIQAFANMLYTGGTRGLARYGISVQAVSERVRELQAANSELSDSAAKQQAVLEIGATKMEAVKAAGGHAVTATEELKAALTDLRGLYASWITPVIEPTIKNRASTLHEFIDTSRLQSEYQKTLDDLNALGEREISKGYASAANQELLKFWDGMARAALKGPAGLEDGKATLVEYGNALEKLNADARAYTESVLEAGGGDEAFRIGLARSQAAFREAYPDGYNPLKTFNEALDESRTKLTSVTALQTRMAEAAGQLEALTKSVAMPEMPKNLAEFDASAWRAWADAMGQISGAAKDAAEPLRRVITATEEAQLALLEAAQAAPTAAEGLSILSVAAGNVDGDVLKLAQSLDKLPPAFQIIVQNLGGFEAAYNEMIDQAIDKSHSLETTWKQLVDAGTQFRTLAEGGFKLQAPEMPKDLTYDTGPMRRYLDDLAAAEPAAARLVQRTREQVAAFESAQQAVIAHSMSLSTSAERMDALARAFLGPGATIEDLVEKFGELPKPVRDAIDPVEALYAALQRLQSQASTPITIDVRMQGLQDAMGEIDSMSLRLAGLMDPALVRKFRDSARADITQHWQEMGDTDEFGMKLQLAALTGGYDKMVQASQSYYTKSEDALDKHLDNIANSASEMEGKIQAALQAGVQVTPLDMQATKAGTYKDKALESARQLDAIFQRGFKELKAHPDWATMLKIPPDIMAGSEDALKAWAGQTMDEVKDLTRPDLINWDAFGAQWDKMQQDQQKKGFTLDYAVNFLKTTGRLAGKSPEETNKEVARLMGLANPEVTIDALFQKAPKARPSDLVSAYLNGKDAVDINAKLVPINKYNPADFGLNEDGTPIRTQRVKPPVSVGGQAAGSTWSSTPMSGAKRAEAELNSFGAVFNTGTAPRQLNGTLNQVDLKPAGGLLAATMIGGLTAGFDDPGIAPSVAARLRTGFNNSKQSFLDIGTWAGGQIVDATAEAAGKGSGEVIKRMATAVAPEVWKLIQGKAKGQERQ